MSINWLLIVINLLMISLHLQDHFGAPRKGLESSSSRFINCSLWLQVKSSYKMILNLWLLYYYINRKWRELVMIWESKCQVSQSKTTSCPSPFSYTASSKRLSGHHMINEEDIESLKLVTIMWMSDIFYILI